MGKTHRFIRYLMILSLLGLAVSITSAATMSCPDTLIKVGQTAQVPITLDSALTGLSGYNITCFLSPTPPAEIIAIGKPPWGPAPYGNSTVPTDSYWVAAGDFMNAVEAGAINVPLTIPTLRGDAVGIATLGCTATRMDNDLGNPVGPQMDPCDITVWDDGPICVPPPAAGFSGSPVEGCAPLSVTFDDASTGANLVSWEWDFGDDSPLSNAQNPVHPYAAAGLYDVSLKVCNSCQQCNTKVIPNYITVKDVNDPECVGIGYTAEVTCDQDTSITRVNGAFGLIKRGESKLLNPSVYLVNNGCVDANVEARFTTNYKGLFGLLSGTHVLEAKQFEMGPSGGTLVPLSNAGTDVLVAVAPVGSSNLDAKLTVPSDQATGAYAGTVVLTFSNAP